MKRSILKLFAISFILIMINEIPKANGQLQETKFHFDDATPFDDMGTAVAVSGDYAVVTIPADDDYEYNCGSAAIYRKTNDEWVFLQKIYPNEPKQELLFGKSAAIYKNYIVIGCPDSDEFGYSTGVAYIYKLNDLGFWEFFQKIKPTNAKPNERFGGAVSMSGDLMAISSNGMDENGVYHGMVSIYRLDRGGWSIVQKLGPNNGDIFYSQLNEGASPLSMSKNNLAIGGRRGYDEKLVYVYTVKQYISPFKLDQILTSSISSSFGNGVGVSDKFLAIGAPFHKDEGIVYTYVRNSSGKWVYDKTLHPDNLRFGAKFGGSISISDNLIVVGASRDGSFTNGSAFVYDLDNPASHPEELFHIEASDATPASYFGCAVSISQKDILIGAFRDRVSLYPPEAYGAAYMYQIINKDNLSNNAPNHTANIYHNSKIQAFPNPSNGVFTIDNTEGKAHTLQITDFAGRLILKKNIEQSKVEIDISKEPKGIYSIVLIDNNEVQVQKVIKK